MTREQMIDEAVRRVTSAGFRHQFRVVKDEWRARWMVKAATRLRRDIAAEFRRIAEREAAA